MIGGKPGKITRAKETTWRANAFWGPSNIFASCAYKPSAPECNQASCATRVPILTVTVRSAARMKKARIAQYGVGYAL